MSTMPTPAETLQVYQRWMRSLHELIHPQRSMELHLCNAALGIGGEFEEMLAAMEAEKDDLVLEEAGDVLAYVVLLADLMRLEVSAWAPVEQNTPPPSHGGMTRITTRAIFRLQEQVKKLVMQPPKAGVQEKIAVELKLVFLNVIVRARLHEWRVQDLVLANVDKLKARYPDPTNTIAT
jgi:hypothetical protein